MKLLPKHKSNTVLFFAVVFLIILSSPLYSQIYDLDSDMKISWETGEITITAEAAVPEDSDNLTTERFKISESIDRDLTEIATESFSKLYLDSLISVKDFLKENQSRMTSFDSLNYTKQKVSSSFSRNLSAVVNTYRFNLFTDLMPLLINHKTPSEIRRILTYEPTASFSGIVIYAADVLPLYGEQKTGRIQPAVFPKIYDSDMNIVASAEMAYPESLEKWGFAAYTEKVKDLSSFEERIGKYPFYTTAEAVFGNNRTDILIPEEAAKRILYNEANRRLIREGRILIIMSPEQHEDGNS